MTKDPSDRRNRPTLREKREARGLPPDVRSIRIAEFGDRTGALALAVTQCRTGDRIVLYEGEMVEAKLHTRGAVVRQRRGDRDVISLNGRRDLGVIDGAVAEWTVETKVSSVSETDHVWTALVFDVDTVFRRGGHYMFNERSARKPCNWAVLDGVVHTFRFTVTAKSSHFWQKTWAKAARGSSWHSPARRGHRGEHLGLLRTESGGQWYFARRSEHDASRCDLFDVDGQRLGSGFGGPRGLPQLAADTVVGERAGASGDPREVALCLPDGLELYSGRIKHWKGHEFGAMVFEAGRVVLVVIKRGEGAAPSEPSADGEFHLDTPVV